MESTHTQTIRTLYAPLRTLEYTIRTNMRTFTQNALIMRMMTTLKELIYRKNKLTYSTNIGNRGKNFLRKQTAITAAIKDKRESSLFVYGKITHNTHLL